MIEILILALLLAENDFLKHTYNGKFFITLYALALQSLELFGSFDTTIALF